MNKIKSKLFAHLQNADPAHDILHAKRVTNTAEHIARAENADLAIVIPAAILHDIVILPKDHPDSLRSSDLAAEKAKKILEEIDYPKEKIEPILYAIQTHSFGKGIKPETKEAQIVQDADRLDAIGAIGIARTFSVGAKLNRPFYNENEPFAKTRELNDKQWTLDHFYIKLLKLKSMMNTQTAKKMAQERQKTMVSFLDAFQRELSSTNDAVHPGQ